MFKGKIGQVSFAVTFVESDNQEHDNTEDDETPVNPGLSMALEYLRKYQQDSNLDQREHEDCMDTHK